MVDSPSKKQKKGLVSEEDVCTLLQRYTATTVLTLLRELAQSADVNIDWNVLVQKTTSGISNARECQMLWRHLAYRQPLIEKIEEEAQPLDDDSDLEFELEASPPVSTEATMEAANCVKVLASGTPIESSIPNNSTVEGDMPNGHSSKLSSENPHSASLLYSSNITLLPSVLKQPQSAGISGEGSDANGSANIFPSRRKRKPWSEEEDLELIAAVRKFGEGNWANIVKGEFKGDRTASQLSQRWAIIRKKQGSLNIGGTSSIGSQLSEAQLATRRAIDMALKDNLTAAANGTTGNSTSANLSASNVDSPITNITVPSQLQLPPVTNPTSIKPLPLGSTPKPRPPPNNAPTKLNVSAGSIQAAAVAAGARIASPSDAACLLKAAQSKNAVRITGGGSLVKSPAAATTSSLPPNVHFIRTGLAATQPAMAPGTAPYGPGGQQPKGSSVKPSGPTGSVSQLSRAKSTPTSASERTSIALSSSANEPQPMEDGTSTDVKVPVGVQEDNASAVKRLAKAPVDGDQLTSPGADVNLGKQAADVGDVQCAISKDLTENERKNEISEQVVENHIPEGKSQNRYAVQGSCVPSVNGRHEVLPSLVDGDTEKMEVTSEASTVAEKSDPMEL